MDITADLLTRRQSEHVTRQLLDIDLEPAGDLETLGGNQSLLDGKEITVLLADSDNVAGLDEIGRDVNTTAVHGEVTVTHGLTCLLASAGKAQTENNIVETGLENDHQVLAGNALHLTSTDEVAVELLLEHAVDELNLLLLAQLHAVLGFLATALGLADRFLLAAVTKLSGIDPELTAALENRSPVDCHSLSILSVTRDDASWGGSRCAGWESCPGCSKPRGQRPGGSELRSRGQNQGP